MQKINFNKYKFEYKNLLDSDIILLNSLFENKNIKDFLEKKEVILEEEKKENLLIKKNRKIGNKKVTKTSIWKFFVITFYMILFITGLFLFLLSFLESSSSYFIIGFFLMALPTYLIINDSNYKTLSAVKREKEELILNNIFKNKGKDIFLRSILDLFGKNLTHNFGTKYFGEKPFDLYKKISIYPLGKKVGISKKLFSAYSGLKKYENSLGFKIILDDFGNYAQINSIKIETISSEQRKNWTSNNFYLFKINFINGKANIKKPIGFLKKTVDLNLNNRIKSVIIVTSILIIPYYLGLINISYLFDREVILILLSILFPFLLTLFFLKTKLKGFSVSLERKFDIFSFGKASAKKFLSENTISEILNYIKKISKRRVYEFLFSSNEIYVKYNILETDDDFGENISSVEKYKGKKQCNNFMEFDFSKGDEFIYTNIIEAYLEIKNIKDFSKEMSKKYY